MNMKSKLMAAIAMLLVSTVMMTTASFAWFTISTAPEVSNIETKVVSNGNLEIALATKANDAEPDASGVGDSGDNAKWGNLVDLKDDTTIGSVTLMPVGYTAHNTAKGNPFTFPSYGLDGRIKELLTTTAGDTTNGITVYKDGDGAPIAFRIDFWMRTNVAGSVSLSDVADRGNGENGLGSILSDPRVSVAFQTGTATAVEATRAASGKLTADNIVTFSADEVAVPTAKLVSMYVFMDGTEVTNVDMSNAAADALDTFELSVQFKHSVGLNAMDAVTQDVNGRQAGIEFEATEPEETDPIV